MAYASHISRNGHYIERDLPKNSKKWHFLEKGPENGTP